MGAAVRELEVAINWRVTLLGLNLAAWLVFALIVAALFVRRDLAGGPVLAPGFGYAIPMFEDLSAFSPAKADGQPAVGLRGIGGIPQDALHPRPPKAEAPGRGLSQRGLGSPRRLGTPEDPRALQEAYQPGR
jgi:hypothetical protein